MFSRFDSTVLPIYIKGPVRPDVICADCIDGVNGGVRLKRRRLVGLLSTFSCAICPLLFGATAHAQTAHVEVNPPAGDFAVVNGAKLWYESEGKGEPLLLIPGGPGTAHDYFHPFFSDLTGSCRIIYFDAFGRGKSDRAKSPAEYTFDRDVEDIEGLRRALALGKINILGHSYGGAVAEAYALKYPESVKRLILADTLFSGQMWQAGQDVLNYELRNQFPEMWQKVKEVRAQGYRSSAKEHQDVYQLPEGLLYFYDASNANKVTQDWNPEVFFSIAGHDANFLIGGDIAKLDFRTQLKNLKVPILVIAGRYDRVSIPKYALQFKKYAPQAQFVMFEKSGHFPFIEENAETIRVLREFLTK